MSSWTRKDTAPDLNKCDFQLCTTRITDCGFEHLTTHETSDCADDDQQIDLIGNKEPDDFPALSGKDWHSICPVEARLDSTPHFNVDNFQRCFAITRQRSESNCVISILYQNVRGLRTKVDEFFVAVSDVQYDVIVLTETWLNECFHSAQLFGDYHVYRCDRNPLSTGKSRGGGV